MHRKNFWSKLNMMSVAAVPVMLALSGIGQSTALAQSAGRDVTVVQRAEMERALWGTLSEEHKSLLLRKIAARDMQAASCEPGDHSGPRAAMCFAPGTPDSVVQAFDLFIPFGGQEFNQAGRWDATALNPTDPGNQGDPTTLTWGIVPDGLNLEDNMANPPLPSILRTWLDGLYGNQATWLPVIQSVFDRWSSLSGLNYQYEPNDDGAQFVFTDGLAGVRADVRIGGYDIDGNSGILAFNYYPGSGGDMVLNANDSFYSDLSNSSLRLRNVLSHEHGHGVGMAHVCPVTSTKLMEPFVSTAYDGPRMDDIRNAHRHYGDAFEPNNSTAQFTTVTLSGGAATVGTIPAPTVLEGSLCSIDDVSDVDVYRFAIPAGRVTVSVRVQALGWAIDDSQQACSGYNASCCVGSLEDARTACTLTIELLNGVGSLLGTATTTNLDGEQFVQVPVNNALAQNYFVRASSGSCVRPPQMYTLVINATQPVLSMKLNANTPLYITPGSPTNISINAQTGSQTLNATTPRLFHRVQGTVPYTQVTMANLGLGIYQAALPAATCGQVLEYYFQATSTAGTNVLLPATGVFSSEAGTPVPFYTDTFEADQGWTTGPNTATSGFWVRSDPNGTAAQPEDDTTAAGVNCWFTQQGNQGEATGANDVDGGAVVLTSPIINASGKVNARVAYQLWYCNGAGAGAYNDSFLMEYSTNGGGAWQTAQTIGPGSVNDLATQATWIRREWRLPPGAATSQLRLRFTVNDANPQSALEGAIDDFQVLELSCGVPSGCDSIDFNNDGVSPDSLDLDDFISVFAGGPCSTGTCNDIDFNNDGVSPDSEDIDALIRVFSGGAC